MMEMSIVSKDKKVRIQCPICKTMKTLNIPESIINERAQLTTMSIQKDTICDHHFQVFIDRDFKVRGYQKVDYEFKNGFDVYKESEKKEEKKIQNEVKTNDEDLFKNLYLEDNFVEWHPSNFKKPSTTEINEKLSPTTEVNKVISKQKENKPETSEHKEMSLQEIYEEFWEIIDENNPEFQEFILRDKRRDNWVPWFKT